MKAVVLVGGEGTRLRPLTFTTPKQMLAVVEVPLIERVVGHLASSGVDEVVLSLGYRPDAFITAFPDGTCAGVPVRYAVEPEPMDTAGAIAFALGEVGRPDDTFLAANGDVLTDADIGALVKFHAAAAEAGAKATILLTPVEDPSAFGVVPTDVSGRVTAFIEKPAPGTAPTNLINAGIYVLEPSILDLIPTGRRCSIERETFPRLVGEGRLYAFDSDAYWLDTGTPDKYLQAHNDLLSGRRPGPPAPGATEVAPGHWQLGQPGDVAGDIGGGSLLGEGASVAAGASVRGSVVGRGASVGGGAAVVGSVLLAGARVEENARVERSIIGEHAVVGDGAVITNLSVIGGKAEIPPGARLDDRRVPDPAAMA
jgi:NDP-sugar pyrophosphorylase family protein